MRAFYIQAINISSRVVGDDDTFGSICEFDGRAFRGCCAMGESVRPSQSHASYPAIGGEHNDRMLLLHSTLPCVRNHISHAWRRVRRSYWGTERISTLIPGGYPYYGRPQAEMGRTGPVLADSEKALP